MPTSAPGAVAPDHVDREPVREQQMVRGCERVRPRRPAGCVLAEAVAEPGGDPGLVVGDPERDAVAEPAGRRLGELAERLRGLALRPAARVLERDWGGPSGRG